MDSLPGNRCKRLRVDRRAVDHGKRRKIEPADAQKVKECLSFHVFTFSSQDASIIRGFIVPVKTKNKITVISLR